MTKQRWYQCATCSMAEDGYCICQICIKTCHEGHNILQTNTCGLGFCDCGEEGSRGIRPCKMLQGKFVASHWFFIDFVVIGICISWCDLSFLLSLKEMSWL